jgi:hypothetical protein
VRTDVSSISITKIEAAREQLKEAILLFLQRKNPVVVHTLASAAHQVLYDLCRVKGIDDPSILYDKSIIKAEMRKELIRLMREPQNFFKHAENDSEKILKFYPDNTHLHIFDAIEMWNLLSDELVAEFVHFRIWVLITNPNFLADGNSKAKYEEYRIKYSIDIDDFDAMLSVIRDVGI